MPNVFICQNALITIAEIPTQIPANGLVGCVIRGRALLIKCSDATSKVKTVIAITFMNAINLMDSYVFITIIGARIAPRINIQKVLDISIFYQNGNASS